MVSLGRLYGINYSHDIWWLVSDHSIKTDRGKVCALVAMSLHMSARYKSVYIFNFFLTYCAANTYTDTLLYTYTWQQMVPTRLIGEPYYLSPGYFSQSSFSL